MSATAPATTAAERPSGRHADRLRRLGICVPATLIDRASGIAASRRMTRNAVLKIALERGLGGLDAREPESEGDAQAGGKRPPETLEQLRFRIGTEQKRRIEAFAARKGWRDLSSAIADLVTRALDAEDLGDNVPATKAEEIDQRLQEVRELADQIGPGVFGILGLLSHWATQSGGLEVDEDELVEEAMTAGRQAWAMRQEIAADEPAGAPALGEEGGL